MKYEKTSEENMHVDVRAQRVNNLIGVVASCLCAYIIHSAIRNSSKILRMLVPVRLSFFMTRTVMELRICMMKGLPSFRYTLYSCAIVAATALMQEVASCYVVMQCNNVNCYVITDNF